MKLQSSEGFSGARESASKEAHSHGNKLVLAAGKWPYFFSMWVSS